MFVYILECADGKTYTGTYRGSDIETRLGEHNCALYPEAWTASRLPVKLLWCQNFDRATDAITLEKQLKKWSRAKKDAFIRGDIRTLKTLAQSKSRPAIPQSKPKTS